MTKNAVELGRMVLQAVANDYEELEMITNEIRKSTSVSDDDPPDRDQIEHALTVSISEKDVKAYRVSEASGQLVPVSTDPQELRTLWFYITEQGKERLRRLELGNENSGIDGM